MIYYINIDMESWVNGLTIYKCDLFFPLTHDSLVIFFIRGAVRALRKKPKLDSSQRAAARPVRWSWVRSPRVPSGNGWLPSGKTVPKKRWKDPPCY
jgi:hypothetical protein